MTEHTITESSGNIFIDMGYPADEAAVLGLRADLMAQLRLLIQGNGWSQQQAAQHLNITQSRVSDLVRGKWEKFSIDMLITLAARAGQSVQVELTP